MGGLEPAKREAVECYLTQVRRDLRLPGLAVGIVQDGEVVYLRGFGDAAPGRSVTPQTPFVLGSVSKTFTAIAVMQLVELGELDLDAPVQRYLPWFRLASADTSSQITLRHLLSHTSGLSRFTGRVLLGGRGEKTLEQSVRDLAAVRLRAPVGAKFQYSNSNYAVLGLLVQEVSGMPYETYIQQHIFQSLGMKHSYTSEREALADGMAVGYRWWFGVPIPGHVPYLPDARPAAFLISSAQDMTSYMLACLDAGSAPGGSLLSSASFEEMYTSLVSAGPSSSYALGWRVEEIGGECVRRHGGETANFLSELVLVPGHRLGVVVLLNCNNGVAAQLGIARIATGVVRVLLGMSPVRVRPSFGVFYLVVNALVIALSGLQVWLGLSLLLGSLSPLAPLAPFLVFITVLLPSLSIFLLPRLRVVDSPWSLLRSYVPDLSAWLWLTAFFSVFIAVVWGVLALVGH